MTRKTFVLKLGGSIIAPKNAKRPFLRVNLLKNIAETIRDSGLPASARLVIVHGGGSLCHPIAKRFGLALGTRGDRSKEQAALKVREICRGMSRRIARILSTSLPIEIVDIPTIAANRDGTLDRLDITPVSEALDRGAIPLLSGNIVDDATLGMSIASGDDIAVFVGSKLQAESVFFATDVDGIFEEDPKQNRRAIAFDDISLSELKNRAGISGSVHTDATGGMANKLEGFSRSHARIRQAFVFDGRRVEAYGRLSERPFPFGTRISIKKGP